jgi:ubiquinone/menaquinone biosynthesis C-methylase UbiE
VRAWNHNTHFHRRLLRLLPRSGEAALDVGCGDGAFAALLAERFGEVVALDPDPEQIAATTARCRRQSQVRVERSEFLSSDLPSGSFDVVTALASFHHMPFDEAAAEARRVLKPGGRLVVLGVWTDATTRVDLAWKVGSGCLNRTLHRVRGPDLMTAPATFERTSWHQVKALASTHLPGTRMRRHLLWRYILVWQKPDDGHA